MSILSIQSWVTYGHVGNASAIFPLQRMGFEVWGLHTVQFSNHTGYESFKGTVFPASHLTDILDGLSERRAFAICDAVLSGYMGNRTTTDIVLDAIDRVRQANQHALYCCDPVMGDIGGLYVSSDIPPLIKTKVISHADIVTPNHFELEVLTDRRIKTHQDALEAAHILQSMMRQEGPQIVLITSLLCSDTPKEHIETMAISDSGAWLVRTPHIPLEPPCNGSGDAIAALFLGHYLKTRDSKASLEKAVSALYYVLNLTHRKSTREIQLIAAQDEFIQPSKQFEAQTMNSLSSFQITKPLG
jgi:pyridoxine kinase